MLLSANVILSRLIRLYAVPEHRVAAFKARLKHFQRLGWPIGSNFGRGRRANWTDRHYQELVIATELTMLGITPERAIEIMKANYTNLLRAAERAAVCEIHVPPLVGDAVPRSTIRVDLSALS
jgi:hypothetical protein